MIESQKPEVKYKIHLNELMKELVETCKNLQKLSNEKLNNNGAKSPPHFS
jgi:hypothetical protein